MVTEVLDQQGNMLHSCKESGCEVSWDGYEIESGDPVGGRSDPDPDVWQIQGKTAKLRKEG